MDDNSHTDIIQLLQQNIKQEEENYARALEEGRLFWELKEIRTKYTSCNLFWENFNRIIRIKNFQSHRGLLSGNV